MSNIVSGRQLRAARIFAGLTHAQFAKAVGVDEGSVRYWELKDDGLPTLTIDLLGKDRGGATAKWRCSILVAD